MSAVSAVSDVLDALDALEKGSGKVIDIGCSRICQETSTLTQRLHKRSASRSALLRPRLPLTPQNSPCSSRNGNNKKACRTKRPRDKKSCPVSRAARSSKEVEVGLASVSGGCVYAKM